MVSLHLPSVTHDYQQFSDQYAKLKIEGTYYLAFKPIVELIGRYRALGKRALDFGCGSGRSTRFLKSLGFNAIGVDKSEAMIRQAQGMVGGGVYLHLDSETLPFPDNSFNFIFQSFVLLEYSSIPAMVSTFRELNRVLIEDGLVVVITGSEAYYQRNWLSFELDCAENQTLASGDKARVSIRGTDIVLFDYYWTDRDYRQVFQQSSFDVVETLYPIAQGDEPFDWVNECEFPCWAIYVLKK
jgi:ubiquinone/menaquinone biosynthesis C-methylase UbiE